MVDAWLVALGFAANMVGAWHIGWRVGRRKPTTASEDPGIKFTDGSMALLGLLLAFTFAMALGRHDSRRLAVVAECNAIGDFYTCATLLKDPVRSRLQQVIHEYARLRLDMELGRLPAEQPAADLQKCFDFHSKMTTHVAEAVRQETPIAISLTSALNNLTSTHASRLAAYQESLPWSIVVLLFLSAIFPAFLLGQRQGEATNVHLIGTFCFIFMVALVIFVILDLNQPARGLITVNVSSLEQVVRSTAN